MMAIDLMGADSAPVADLRVRVYAYIRRADVASYERWVHDNAPDDDVLSISDFNVGGVSAPGTGLIEVSFVIGPPAMRHADGRVMLTWMRDVIDAHPDQNIQFEVFTRTGEE